MTAFLLICASIARAGGVVEIPPRQVAEDAAPRKLAIVVGQNEYDDDLWTDLRYAEDDATDVALFLGDEAGYTVEPLIGDATVQRFRSMVDQAALTLRPQDTLLIYIAAHGQLVQRSGPEAQDGLMRYVVALADSPKSVDPGDQRQIIDVDALRLDVRQRVAAQTRLLILDTCLTGRFELGEADTFRGVEEHGPAPTPLVAVPGELYVTAAASNQPAREVKDLGHGLFTYHLLSVARSWPDSGSSPDGWTSWQEILDETKRQVREASQALQVPQVPEELGAEILVGQARSLRGPRLILDGASELPSEVRLDFRVDGQPVSRRDSPLSAGRHRLSVRVEVPDDLPFSVDARRSVNGEVDLNAWDVLGQRVQARLSPGHARGYTAVMGRWSGSYESLDESDEMRLLPATMAGMETWWLPAVPSARSPWGRLAVGLALGVGGPTAGAVSTSSLTASVDGLAGWWLVHNRWILGPTLAIGWFSHESGTGLSNFDLYPSLSAGGLAGYSSGRLLVGVEARNQWAWANYGEGLVPHGSADQVQFLVGYRWR